MITMVIFAMHQGNLEGRLGIIVTMFLSLTAMQFVIDSPPSEYLNSLQQLSLLAYSLLLAATFESLAVAKLVSLAQQAQARKEAGQALTKFRWAHMCLGPAHPLGCMLLSPPLSHADTTRLTAFLQGCHNGSQPFCQWPIPGEAEQRRL